MGCGNVRYSSGVKRVFLVDCNNFFVSCERVFNASLIGKPVVVLSSNDGCVISRSNEAKALGIKMGVPAFECESLFKKYGVRVFSSNFALYADMSDRVMRTLAAEAVDIEIYSIDEAFLHVHSTEYSDYGRYLSTLVRQRTGIPVSVGIGPTKTLAKVANLLAKKKEEYKGVFDITEHPSLDDLLADFPVSDVWGVGYRYTKNLLAAGIRTARDLKYAPDEWIRKKLARPGLKTVFELRGIECIKLMNELVPKKSITVSRSFGRILFEQKHLLQAVAFFMIRAAQKLRKEGCLASTVTVFIATSYYEGHNRYVNSVSYVLPVATAYTPDLLHAVEICLHRIFKQGYRYKKAGVILSNFVLPDQMQLSLFSPLPNTPKQETLMKVCDTINSRFGSILSYAVVGFDQTWKAQCMKRSPHYTTSWNELLVLEI